MSARLAYRLTLVACSLLLAGGALACTRAYQAFVSPPAALVATSEGSDGNRTGQPAQAAPRAGSLQRASVAAEPAGSPRLTIPAAGLARAFGLDDAEQATAAAPARRSEPDPRPAAAETTYASSLQLKGIVFSERGGSAAVVVEEDGRTTHAAGVGDVVNGERVEEVGRTHAILMRDGKRARLELATDRRQGSPPANPTSSAARTVRMAARSASPPPMSPNGE